MDPLTRTARAAQTGDDRALAALVEAVYDPVWRLCAALIDSQSADDLAQEAILAAVRSLHNYRGDSTAKTWILGVARHTCLDELRTRTRRRHRDHQVLAAATPVRPTTSEDASQTSIVSDLLTRLDPDRRAAFILTQIIGLTYQEAAQVCECPTGTIRSRVARARAELLSMLNTHPEPSPHSRTGT